MNTNDPSNNTYLARMLNISTLIKPRMESTAMCILIMITQINTLRWCLNESMINGLVELDKVTQM